LAAFFVNRQYFIFHIFKNFVILSFFDFIIVT
jgi:hypothetical protein